MILLVHGKCLEFGIHKQRIEYGLGLLLRIIVYQTHTAIMTIEHFIIFVNGSVDQIA
jgi:hypothetical protein